MCALKQMRPQFWTPQWETQAPSHGPQNVLQTPPRHRQPPGGIILQATSATTLIKYSVLFLSAGIQWPLLQCNHTRFISINIQFTLRHTLHLSVRQGTGEWIMNTKDPTTSVHLKATIFVLLFILARLIIHMYINS